MFTEVVFSFIAILLENCTGVLIIRKTTTDESTGHPEERDDEETGLIQLTKQEKLKDFTNFDQNDAIFREYDPLSDEETDPKGWRRNLPSRTRSLLKSLKIVFIIQTVCGTLIGLMAIVLVFIDLNTANMCLSTQKKYRQLPQKAIAIRRMGHAIEDFVIQFYDFFLLWTVFSWSQLKHLNLVLTNTVVAFLDVTYGFAMSLFQIFDESWIDYPRYFLFTSNTIINAVILARFFLPQPKKFERVLRLSFVFSAQFLFGMTFVMFLCNIFWPWYNKQDEYTKVLYAAMSPLMLSVPKLVCRLIAQKIKVIHPGSCHVFVSVIYGTAAIVYRVMQAELSSMSSFILLGIAHGLIDLIERLTVTMRDYIWEYVYLVLRCKRRRTNKYRSSRSRRFVADMSIQILLHEGTGLVVGLGFIHLYHFMFSNVKAPYTDYEVLLRFVIRVLTGLTIDLFFNTISVLLQMRVMNIAVVKVWKKRWRHHCLITAIVAMETMFFFDGYLFSIVRHKYDYKTHPMVRYAWNCTEPFAQL